MIWKKIFPPSIEFRLSAWIPGGSIIETYPHDIRSARQHFRHFVENLPPEATSASLRMIVREERFREIVQDTLVESWERGPDGVLRQTFRREWDFAGGNIRRRL